MTTRSCFTLHLRPERLEDYRTWHREVWPEMLVALRDTGWANYSLFLREDGLLVGYVETDDLDAARSAMDALDVNRRWQEAMAQFLPEGQRPDHAFQVLDEVFNLDDQLAALRPPRPKDLTYG